MNLSEGEHFVNGLKDMVAYVVVSMKSTILLYMSLKILDRVFYCITVLYKL